VGLAATGLGTQWALEAADVLARRGVKAAVLHAPTLKPLDRDAVAAFCSRFAVVTTVENHSTVGGLADAVASVLTDRGLGTRIVRLGVPDRWADAGSLAYVRAQLSLDADAIANAAGMA
jgi:transketolase